jgi:outer membrane protein assembly factor BamB
MDRVQLRRAAWLHGSLAAYLYVGLERLMGVARRPAGQGVLAIVAASGMALLAGLNAAEPAAARVSSGRSVPASSGGARQWVSFYTGPGANDDFADSVAVAHSGSAVFVTGNSSSAAGTVDYATVGYDASTGAKLWANRYDGAGGAGGRALAVAVDPAGRRVFVTGESPGPGSGPDYTTIAYNAVTGARLWLSRYDGPVNGGDYAYGVAVSPDGSKVFVSGSSDGGPTATKGDYATVAYDAATGAQLWVSRYSGPGNSEDIATSLAVGPHGTTVYVTGGSGLDYATVAYNAVTGAQLWVSRRLGYARSIAIGSGGGTVYVTGTSGISIATVAYKAATGAKRWVSHYNGAGRSGSRASAVAVSPRGGMVYVTGAAALDYATVAYSAATGARRWARRYDGPGESDSGARQVAVGPRGHTVYITGASGNDVATVAYNAATGASRWVRLYPGAGISLAVSPVTGTVFVTGLTERAASFRDYATIAYHG